MTTVRVKRVYDPPAADDGFRILVDRLWPRGVRKEAAALDLWFKDIAPSPELRTWFNHDVARWSDFRTRYRAELKQHPEELKTLRGYCARGPVTLLFGARDAEHNQAVVLKEMLERA